MDRQVYCKIADSIVTLNVKQGATVKDLLEQVSSYKPSESESVPRLLDSNGYLVPIGPNIPENSENSCYKLEFSKRIDDINMSASPNC
jgi:hypothetical protein